MFETGTPVVPRANTNDILDPSLTTQDEYFVRFVDSATIELYDTYGHATNTSSTTGLISYTTIGNTSSSTFSSRCD